MKTLTSNVMELQAQVQALKGMGPSESEAMWRDEVSMSFKSVQEAQAKQNSKLEMMAKSMTKTVTFHELEMICGPWPLKSLVDVEERIERLKTNKDFPLQFVSILMVTSLIIVY